MTRRASCAEKTGETSAAVWRLLQCYVSGRHEYRVWCEPGAIYLQCPHCGRRSSGWAIDDRAAPANRPQRLGTTRLRHATSGSGPASR